MVIIADIIMNTSVSRPEQSIEKLIMIIYWQHNLVCLHIHNNHNKLIKHLTDAKYNVDHEMFLSARIASYPALFQ